MNRIYVADEVDIASLDILDDHDLLLGQEVEREIVDGVSEDALLDENDIGTAVDDLLDEPDDVGSLLLQHLVDLRVVLNHDVAVNVSLRRRQAELEKCNFRAFDFGRTAARCRGFVVSEDYAFTDLDVIDGAAHFLHDLNVVQIDVPVGFRVADLEHRVDCDRRQGDGVLRDDLAGERGGHALDQLVRLFDVDRSRDRVQHFECFVQRNREAVADCGRMDSHFEESFALLHHRAGKDDDRSGAVTCFDILRLGSFNQDLGGRMKHGEVLQDGRAVVGDQDFAFRVLDHLVHAFGAERSAEDVRER